MGFGDNIQGSVTDLDNAIAREYQLRPVAQFARFGKTSRWASFGKQVFKAKRFCYPVYYQPVAGGVIRSDYATARTSAFPEAKELSHKMLSWGYTQQSIFRSRCKLNILDSRRLDGGKSSVYDLALKVVNESEADFADTANRAFHQDSTCSMGTIAAVYDEDGTTYTSGNRYAYLHLTDASIAQYLPGMVLTSNNAGSLTVLDVHPAPRGLTTITVAMTPGIVIDAGSGNTCNAVVAGQTLRISGETTGDNIWGLPAFFSTSNYYYDEDGNVQTRTSAGSAWQLPYRWNYIDGTTNATFDLDTHLRPMANALPQMLPRSRKARSQGMGISERAMIAVGPADIINEATQEARDNQEFTRVTASSMDEAKRRALFGEVGFEGIYWHSATMPVIGFEVDPMARPHILTFLDPEAWHWLSDGEALNGVEWMPGTINGRWSAVNDTTSNAPTFYIQAACFTMGLVYCDCPGTQFQVEGIGSSV
jgi:hypothetical protein